VAPVDELLKDCQSASPASFAAPSELWDAARKARHGFGRDPAAFLSLFNSTDQVDIAIYWLMLLNLRRVEAKVDERAGKGTWRQLTEEYRVEAEVLATLPHVFTLLASFDRLVLGPPPEGEAGLAVLVDPTTLLFPLMITRTDAGLRLGITNVHERLCGVDDDRAKDGWPPDSRPYVYRADGSWTLQCLATLDDLWSAARVDAMAGAELATSAKDALRRSGSAYYGSDIMRFPPGVSGPRVDQWLQQARAQGLSEPGNAPGSGCPQCGRATFFGGRCMACGLNLTGPSSAPGASPFGPRPF